MTKLAMNSCNMSVKQTSLLAQRIGADRLDFRYKLIASSRCSMRPIQSEPVTMKSSLLHAVVLVVPSFCSMSNPDDP